MEDVPVINLAHYLEDASSVLSREDCEKVASSLHKYGLLLVRDPRVDRKDNDVFLDVMEKYFAQSDGKTDARPELSYQVGVTPENVEVPRNHCERVLQLPSGHRPLTLCPPEADPKMRFFWRLGSRPVETSFRELNAAAVIPAGFPDWPAVMDRWGTKLLASLETVLEMAAEGLGLPQSSFRELMKDAPHLLAPTGSDFSRHGKLGTVLAGYHYDLNLATIHGKSRFPGLAVWLRDGTKLDVAVPDGCLLVQAGKQLEYLTGGHVAAGFHEVAVSEATVAAIAAAAAAGRSLWRVSSTCFGHCNSDRILRPLGDFATPEALSRYSAMAAGDQVAAELSAIALSAASGGDKGKEAVN